MNAVWLDLLWLIGPLSMCMLFVVLGLLSRRLGRVTRARPYYVGFFIAALVVLIGLLTLIVGLRTGSRAQAELIYDGLLAIGVTLAAVMTWRYWSWLLAERG